jgi:hypothetical protein
MYTIPNFVLEIVKKGHDPTTSQFFLLLLWSSECERTI